MRKLLAFLLISASLLACQLATRVEPRTQVAGSWAYVGRFSHLAYYTCLICPGYDPAKAIYTLTLTPDGKLNGRVRNLLIEANYTLGSAEKRGDGHTGTMTISELVVLNKPWETQEDTDFRNYLTTVSAYQYQPAGGFDERYETLVLNTDTYNYLLFVKKP